MKIPSDDERVSHSFDINFGPLKLGDAFSIIYNESIFSFWEDYS